MRLLIILFLASCGGLPENLLAVGYTDELCQPLFSVQLVRLSGSSRSPSQDIRLRHELLFDGLSYKSHVYVPLLESTLAQTTQGRFSWRPPHGGQRSIQSSEKITKDDGWYVNKISNVRHRVENTSGNNWFDYEEGILVEFLIDNTRFSFKRTANKIALYAMNTEARRMVLNAVNLGDYIIIDDGVELYTLSINKSNSISTVSFANSKRQAMVFDYENELITAVNIDSETLRYRWGNPKWSVRAANAYPLPPFVINDGLYKYEMEYTADGIVVNSARLASGEKKYWIIR